MSRFFVSILLFAFCASALAADPMLPNPKLTPGATLSVSLKQICTPGYANGGKSHAKGARNVPESEKRAVYREYGITPRPRAYEIDHLISIELGGSNVRQNLWPQSYTTEPWNAHLKDALEDRLHALVCDGKMSLSEAQLAIRTNWIVAYKKYIGTK